MPFGRGPKLRSRAIELEGGGGARRGAISAHERPRVPRSSAGLAGSRIRVYEMRITRPDELSPRPPTIPDFGRDRPGDFTMSSLRTQFFKNRVLILNTKHIEATTAQEGHRTAAREVVPRLRGMG